MISLFNIRSLSHIPQVLLLLLVWSNMFQKAIAMDSFAIAQSADLCSNQYSADVEFDNDFPNTILVSLLEGEILPSTSKIIASWSQHNESILEDIRQSKISSQIIKKPILITAAHHNHVSKPKSTVMQTTVAVAENPATIIFSDLSGNQYENHSSFAKCIDF